MHGRSTQREVLIPLVSDSGSGSVGRIAADRGLPPPHPAQLERSLSELLEVGLYAAGQAARAAVRHRLGLQFWQPGTAGMSLFPLNPGEFIGLNEENSESAQLGLALALLMCRAQCVHRVVMATGALLPTHGTREVAVSPVAHVGAKLELLAQQHLRPGAPRPPALALIPERDSDGVLTTQRYAVEIARLRELGTDVLPVDTLGAAALAIDALSAWIPPWLQATRIALLSGAVAGAVWLGQAQWLGRHIALEFAPVLDSSGRAWLTPARAASDPLRFAALCPGVPPVISDGEALALAVVPAFAEALSYALVAVSPSGIKLLPLPEPSSGGVRAMVPVTGPAESTLIAVLAWRRPMDLAVVEARLRRRLAGTQPNERIAQARHVLQAAAPGALIYLFQSRTPVTAEASSCAAL